MDAKRIETIAGSLELIPATVDQLRGVARYWPLEIVTSSDDFGRFWLVFQHGDREVIGVKLQHPDVHEDQAALVHHGNRMLIAAALPHYLAKRHRGVLLPCAYYQENSDGKAETGLALFVAPDPQSRPKDPGRVHTLYDDALGDGATLMVLDMISAIAEASRERQMSVLSFINMELRPRLQIGSLAMYFIVQGEQVVVIKDPIETEDPVWEHLVRSGFSSLPSVPLRPAALPSEPPKEMPTI